MTSGWLLPASELVAGVIGEAGIPRAADHDPGGTALRAARGDRDAGDLALELVEDVRVLRPVQRLTADLLLRGTELALLPLDTHARDHDSRELRGGGNEDEVLLDIGTGLQRDLHALRLITHSPRGQRDHAGRPFGRD